MNDSLRVGRIQCAGNLDRILKQFFSAQSATCNPLSEGFSFEQLHRYKVLALMNSDFMHDTNIRMAQRSGGSRFAQESICRSRTVKNLGGRNFSATYRPSVVSSAL